MCFYIYMLCPYSKKTFVIYMAIRGVTILQIFDSITFSIKVKVRFNSRFLNFFSKHRLLCHF